MLDAARELFAEHGYTDTSTAEVARRANVTRGALYRHFRTKAELFEAVFEDVRTEAVQLLGARIQAAEGDAWQRIVVAGCQAFVESVADPRVRRIIHVDAPAILTRAAMQYNAPGFLFLESLVTYLMAEGLLEKMPVHYLSRMLWSALLEVGVYIAQAEDEVTAEAEAVSTMIRLLTGLRPQPASVGRAVHEVVSVQR